MRTFRRLVWLASAAIRRISSGIDSFDAVTSGGIPESTATLVYGPPKAGKSVFAYHFIAESLKEGAACILVTTDYDADELARSMSGFNWSIQEALKVGGIQIIMMMPVASPTSQDASLRSVSLANPTELMLGLNEILKLISEKKVKFRAIRIVWGRKNFTARVLFYFSLFLFVKGPLYYLLSSLDTLPNPILE